MATIEKGGFQKSLDRLQNMAKSQLYHTGSNSEPGGWPGGTEEEQNEWDQKIDDNGTDYQGVRKSLAAKVRKSLALTPAEVAIAEGKNPLGIIGNKVSKGLPLTKVESWAVNTGFTGLAKGKAKPGGAGTPGEADDANSVPDSHGGKDSDEVVATKKGGFEIEVDDDDDDDDDKKNPFGKSLELRKGMELSPFLYEMTRAIGDALNTTETRINKSLIDALTHVVARVNAIESHMSKSYNESGEFQKALAEAVVGIGEQVAGRADLANASARQPVGAPRSQFGQGNGGEGLRVVQKSMGPGGLDMDLSKSQISDAMQELVMKSELAALDVVKFETTGDITSDVRSKVINYISGNNR